MDPLQTPGMTGGTSASSAAAEDAQFAQEFEKVISGMAQGMMSIVMEEMQQIAMKDDEE